MPSLNCQDSVIFCKKMTILVFLKKEDYEF